MKAPTYPTVGSHSDVRCPQCRRSLSEVRERAHPFPEAPFAKHCGAPCYGTAWYTLQTEIRQEYFSPFHAGFKMHYVKAQEPPAVEPWRVLGKSPTT